MTHNPRNANGARRRRVRTQVLAEETHCALCGQPVDKTLRMVAGQHGPRCATPECPGCVPHPMRPEIDEIIPVSKGGDPYDRANCRLTHRVCNQRRGNKTTTTTTTAAGAFPLTDSWGDLFQALK